MPLHGRFLSMSPNHFLGETLFVHIGIYLEFVEMLCPSILKAPILSPMDVHSKIARVTDIYFYPCRGPLKRLEITTIIVPGHKVTWKTTQVA